MPEQMLIVARYEHKHGSVTELFATRYEAERWRQLLADEYWNQRMNEDAPADQKAKADRYFERSNEIGDEFFTVEECEAPAANADTLVAALQRIADLWPEDADDPEEEDYDDTESAYNNGQDVANCTAATIARTALAESGNGSPCVEHFLDISTAHLSQSSRDLLAQSSGNTDSGPTVGDTGFGWFSYAYEATPENEHYPADLRAAWKVARDAGCAYVLFDSDASEIEGLAAYVDGTDDVREVAQ